MYIWIPQFILTVQVTFFVVLSVLLSCLLHGFILIIIVLLTVRVKLGAAVTTYCDWRAHRERTCGVHNVGVLTRWSRVLLEKRVVLWLLRTFPALTFHDRIHKIPSLISTAVLILLDSFHTNNV